MIVASALRPDLIVAKRGEGASELTRAHKRRLPGVDKRTVLLTKPSRLCRICGTSDSWVHPSGRLRAFRARIPEKDEAPLNLRPEVCVVVDHRILSGNDAETVVFNRHS